MLKVAILGASGYTGLELLRILAQHPRVVVVYAGSRQHSGRKVEEVFPFLRGAYSGLVFGDDEPSTVEAELFFCALPHGVSMDVVSVLIKQGKKVVDLSADFRIKEQPVYEKWYKEHTAPELLKDAVYGLPEFYRERIKDATLVANPGCYPTGSLLLLLPPLKEGLIEPEGIIIDAKSGVSGAGRKAALETQFVEVLEGFHPYKPLSHRHTPEIEEVLSHLCGGKIEVSFVPHLLPVARGILTTVYARLKKGVSTENFKRVYEAYYRDEPFVRVMAEGSLPDIKYVRGSNLCDIGIKIDEGKGLAVMVSAIDNLVKGASGQAVQNMNIMYGFPETCALDVPPLGI